MSETFSSSPATGPGQPALAYPERFLGHLIEELQEKYEGAISADLVERTVLESYATLNRTAAVKTHIASRTARFSKDRLTALAQSLGFSQKSIPEVLFVCVGNAGRSQMAAVFAKARGEGLIHVRTAGSRPDEEIPQTVIDSLAELGLDIGEEFPKPLTDDVVRAADVVITMGCGDACPYYPGKRYEDWPLADPKGKGLDEVRAIRDDVANRVDGLLRSLVPTKAH